MNAAFAAIIVAAVIIASSLIFSQSIEETLSRGGESLRFGQGKDFMSQLDASVNSLLFAEINATRRLRLPNARGSLSVSAAEDTVTYNFSTTEKITDGTGTEGGIEITQSGTSMTLRLNYSGSIDVTGDISGNPRTIEIVREGTLTSPELRFRAV